MRQRPSCIRPQDESTGKNLDPHMQFMEMVDIARRLVGRTDRTALLLHNVREGANSFQREAREPAGNHSQEE